MSKKLLIYGLAFGSAAAALSYIYMIYVAFSPNIWFHIFAIFAEFILIPGTAIYLFLNSLRKEKEEEFTIGKAVFSGFFLSLIIAASVSLFFSYIAQFRPEIIAQFTDLKIGQFMKNKIIATLSQKDIDDNIKAIKDSYSVSGQFKYQIYLGAARGLFLSAIIGLILRAKTKKA